MAANERHDFLVKTVEKSLFVQLDENSEGLFAVVDWDTSYMIPFDSQERALKAAWYHFKEAAPLRFELRSQVKKEVG
jgi:hypothetical protein